MFLLYESYNALSTYPDLRHLVHTFTLLTVPLTTALTFLMLGEKLLGFFLFEKVTLLPNTFFLPQTSQIFAMKTPP